MGAGGVERGRVLFGFVVQRPWFFLAGPEPTSLQ